MNLEAPCHSCTHHHPIADGQIFNLKLCILAKFLTESIGAGRFSATIHPYPTLKWRSDLLVGLSDKYFS
jgi:hypothetical protein